MTSIRTVVALAARGKKAKAEAIEILAAAYPPPPQGAAAATEQHPCEGLAKSVHDELQKLTGRNVAFPPTYDEAARQQLMRGW